jgi:hypothetical protein
MSKSDCQVLKGLLFEFMGGCWVYLGGLYLLDYSECLFESPPNIIIFGYLFDYLQTFVNIDDIVHSPSLDLQLFGHLVQFKDGFSLALKFLDELVAELF